ncbi:MAG TPA: cache domain-containing protein [Bacteroidales bacterium]|nr:cache domain-containing protein [Bacteroidales bacterium]HSA44300.1 cache domain-containing protein [Bacteroidales bacterium]
MKFLNLTSVILVAFTMLLSCCNNPEKKAEKQMPSDSLKTVVAKSLDEYVLRSGLTSIDSTMIKDLILAYLDANPAVFGSCIAMVPVISGTDTLRQSLYLFRTAGGYEMKDFGQLYDYTKDQWFAGPASQKKALWSDPYFDAPGGNVDMITYTVPFFAADSSVLGVITADLEMKSSPLAP